MSYVPHLKNSVVLRSAARTGIATSLVCALLQLVLMASAPKLWASGTSERVEVAISQRRLSNGTIRYSVPVQIGDSRSIEAMLDTGSFGLRVLARALSSADYQETTTWRNYRFGGGVVLDGTLAKAVVKIGGISTGEPILFQIVKSVQCGPNKPNCPASKMSRDDYLIGGAGLPREGYEAILGLSMRSPPTEMAALTPLSLIGDRAWIVVLPLPGASAAGRLIINPTADDRAGFRLIDTPDRPASGTASGPGPISTAVPICLDGKHASSQACPPVKLDSGSPDGVLPYYQYAVLYDQKRGVIGLKPRLGLHD